MKKIILLTILLILFVISCGESDVENEVIIDKFTDNQGTYTIDYFYKIGFKVNKEYDVSGLENANGAWFGFWKNNLDKPIDYELRFYPSQQTAIDIGVSLTEEVIGENAVLKKSISSWKEGIQDRRSRNNSSMSGSEANSVRAKYLDYFINGNVIILCSGLDLNYATQNCSELSSNIE